jgi:flagellar basal-body rod protein FlgB
MPFRVSQSLSIFRSGVIVIDPVGAVDPLMLLQKSMDALALQHQVIANNVANIDTPQFKRTVVSFQDQLRAAVDKTDSSPLWRTNSMHFPIQKNVSLKDFQPQVRTITETIGRNDGNNVDLEMEQALLAENNLLYNSLADVTSRYLSGLKHVITEGRQ